MVNKKQAFTLVELIVVITILAILGTIAFISLQGYSANARDSKRVSDINNIKTSLELFSLASGKYPLPDNIENVTLTGTVVTLWKQGTVGSKVLTNLSKNLSEKPVDPLYETEYVYSILSNSSGYELMSLYEGDLQANNLLLNNTYANSDITVRVDGTYNGLFIKASNYIVPTPSIITSEELPLIFDEESIKSQVVNGGENIPDLGTSKVLNSTGTLNFLDFQFYNGTEINKKSSGSDFLDAFDVISNTYSGSNLMNEGIISEFLLKTTIEEKVKMIELVTLGTSTECSNGYVGPDCSIDSFICGYSTVSALGETYTTIIGPDGNCWTSQNIRHGTMLANGATVPSDNNTIEKWCYNSDTDNCDTHGGLYTWSEAMGFDASCNTADCSQVEDLSKSVCGALGTGWSLPSVSEQEALVGFGATGWTGNKLSGIVSALTGLSFENKTTFEYMNTYADIWSSTQYSATNASHIYLKNSDDVIRIDKNYHKASAFPLVCIKS